MMKNQGPYNEYLKTAVKAARAAGKIQIERLGSRLNIRHKGEADLVTDVDLMCEERIKEIVRGRYPDHAFLAEESGGSSGSMNRWIADPLDGTTNYAHAYPFFCASVAFEQDGQVVAGAVYNPVADELFAATRGGGATLNGHSIRISDTDRLNDAMVGTGFSYNKVERMGQGLKFFKRMIMEIQAIRRDGSAALNLCYVACGRFDGFWELTLHPWDIAAGWLIVEEAGGTITRLDGSKMIMDSPDIVASNGILHDGICKTINKKAVGIRPGDSIKPRA